MTVIDDYLKDAGKEQRAEIERIRSLVKQIVPQAEEAKSYGVPAFKYRGKLLVGFHIGKTHMSIYPGSGAIESVKDELKGYDLSKGTVRFSESKPIPENILKRIINYRLKDLDNSN
jgi:uncharacterized protein YdhG (YjbR/CyaY superfamily)